MSIASVALSPVIGEYFGFPGTVSCQSGFSCMSRKSILVYLTVGGSVIPLHILESDSIASVKLRIQTCKGFFVRNQKLVFEGKELARNNSCVQDYGVADGDVLHLVLRVSDLQVITVRTICGREIELHVERKKNVGYVKQQIAKRGVGLFDLKDQELVCNGEELEDQRLIDDICRSNDAVIHFLVRKSAKIRVTPVEKDFVVSIVASDLNGIGVQEYRGQSKRDDIHVVLRNPSFHKEFMLEPFIINPKIVLSPVFKQLIDATFDGLKWGSPPVRSSEGLGGAYFMQDSSGQTYVSVFKPVDEEPMAINNPRGLPLSPDGEGLKRGTRVGEGALREVAAYILDHPKGKRRLSYDDDEKGFAGVPPTLMIKCLHEGFNHSKGFKLSSNNIKIGPKRTDLNKMLKIGSLQMFVKNCGSCEDMGPSVFPIEEVHKISVLDIRLANADRHAGNILVTKDGENGGIVLIPIDHGYCLPENFEDCTFDWLYWPQARRLYSPETVEYIKSLDAEQDIKLLKFNGWDIPLPCARTLRISTMLLKKGAERGLTPFAIGRIMCRETLKKESVIEQIVREAQESVLPGSSEAAFLESVSHVMNHHLDELLI